MGISPLVQSDKIEKKTTEVQTTYTFPPNLDFASLFGKNKLGLLSQSVLLSFESVLLVFLGVFGF